MTGPNYCGDELELFSRATQWKNYLSKTVSPFIRGHVLEVGARLGGTTRHLIDNDTVEKWTCLEPAERLACQIDTDGLGKGKVTVTVVQGTTAAFNESTVLIPYCM